MWAPQLSVPTWEPNMQSSVIKTTEGKRSGPVSSMHFTVLVCGGGEFEPEVPSGGALDESWVCHLQGILSLVRFLFSLTIFCLFVWRPQSVMLRG